VNDKRGSKQEEHVQNEQPSKQAMSGRETGTATQTVRACDLLGERGVVRIEHEGEFYVLRLTRNNRLILTK
jgi:hemin uptake protein HemP